MEEEGGRERRGALVAGPREQNGDLVYFITYNVRDIVFYLLRAIKLIYACRR